MNRHSKLALTAAAFVALSNMAISNPALAVDGKTFSGNGCQSWYGSQRNDFDARHDGAYNNSTGSRWASCPITRDNTTNTNGTRRVWVYAYKSGGPNTSCILRGETSTGGILASDSRSGNGWIYLDINNSVNWGSYMLYCYVPAGGRLSHYFVEEF
jgi:hypothetical protein